MSSGDAPGSSGAKKSKPADQAQDDKQAAKDVVEKASFQTALDIPDDDPKVVKPNEQTSPKAVEVIQMSDDKQKSAALAASDSKDAKKE